MVIGLIDAAIAYKNEKWAKEAEIVLQKNDNGLFGGYNHLSSEV